ncbi:MAG: hypothetical protein JOZ58_26440 [Acetobacteraceae bacterium]|nr:hypothetical protein [Acetobacteraceae bacterium]
MSARSASPRANLPAARGGLFALWFPVLVGAAVIALATPAVLLASILLGPGLIGLAVEGTQGRPVARTMLLSGLAASVSPMRALWDGGPSLDGTLALAFDPGTVGLAWFAAGSGWLLSQLAPIVVRVLLDSATQSRAARLRAERARLQEEWGFGAEA